MWYIPAREGPESMARNRALTYYDTRWLLRWCAREPLSNRLPISWGLAHSPPQGFTPNSICQRWHRSRCRGRENNDDSGTVTAPHRGLSEVARLARIADAT